MGNKEYLFESLREAEEALAEAQKKWDKTEEFQPKGAVQKCEITDGQMELRSEGEPFSWFVVMEEGGEYMVNDSAEWVCVV